MFRRYLSRVIKNGQRSGTTLKPAFTRPFPKIHRWTKPSTTLLLQHGNYWNTIGRFNTYRPSFVILSPYHGLSPSIRRFSQQSNKPHNESEDKWDYEYVGFAIAFFGILSNDTTIFFIGFFMMMMC